MKLYVYDHCPYCVRARMPFGLKSLPLELEILANDDEATPIAMTGKKMLPVLKLEDGSFLPESLDIVARLDQLSGPQLFGGALSPALGAWLDDWNSIVNALVIPRTPDPVYPEFHTASARAYYTRKKEARFGNFDMLLGQTAALKAKMAEGYEALIPLLPDPEGASIDDIHLFPILRSLSVMPDPGFPAPVAAYARRMAERCGVPLVGDLRAAQQG